MTTHQASWRDLASVLVVAVWLSGALGQAPAKNPPGETNAARSSRAKSDRQVVLDVVLAEVNCDSGIGVKPALEYPVLFKRSKVGSFVFTAGTDAVDRFLRSLQIQGSIDIFSRCHTMTPDGEPAVVQVGDDIDSATQGNAQDRTITVIGIAEEMSRRHVGGVLRVTPKITQEGRLAMRLIPEVSSITIPRGHRTDVSKKNITVEHLEAFVTAAAGETVVLGGKINQTAITEAKVPLLGDLPGIGCLFCFDTQTIQKTQLLLFVTPHIVCTRADADSRSNASLSVTATEPSSATR
jgi:type II secretory pathway component GspD/PulD (secretin)